MAKLQIHYLGAPVLRAKAADVGEITEELRALIDDMFETMYHAEGIGLAAPQIGVSKRLIVLDVQDEAAEPMVLINPRIIASGDEEDKASEGCLSMPGLQGVVKRPGRVVVEALNREGQPVRVEGEGLLGRCLQHEIDHLDGVLFIDRLSPLKRSMLLKKWKGQGPPADVAGSETTRERPARSR